MDRTAVEAAILQLEAQRGILPPEVLDLSIAALRQQLDASPGPKERKRVTVLFLDLVGFTTWSNPLDPEVVTDTLNRLWHRLDSLVAAGGGRVDKHIGDALMAVWGLEKPGEDDAARGVKTALAMQEALGAFNADEGLDLAARVGLHTGPVVWGRVGQDERSVMGETVNMASRLERSCPPGGVLISADTYRLVRGLFDLSVQEPLALKGRSEVVQTYLVLKAKARALQVVQRGLVDRESPFVGRKAERDLLADLYQRVVGTGARAAVTVCGEPGMGKSRLLREFEDWSDLQPSPCWLFQGRCDPPFEHSPWALVRDLLVLRLEVPEDRPGAETVAAFEAALAKLWTPDRAAEATPWVTALVGWNPDHRLTADTQILRDRALGFLEDWWSDLALRAPLLFFLEDLHWADDASLGGLEAIFDRLGDRALLVVSNARPGLWDRRPGWGAGRPWHRRVDLAPLSATETGVLVSSLIEGEVWSRVDLVDALVDRAGGNPFFAEELVQAWRESGDEDLDRLKLPATLGAVLDGRLARLSPGARRLAQQAAVVGQTFWDVAVDAAEGRSWGPEPWEELVRADLIVRRGTSLVAGAAEWQFRHALIRQAVLDAGLRDPQKAWHRAVATWLSSLPLADGPGRAAPHWEAAGDRQKAAEAYRAALEAARATRAPEPAIRAADGALALGTWTATEAFDLGLQRCRSLEEASEFDRLKRELDALEPQARALGGEAFGLWFLEAAAFANVFSETSRVDALWKDPAMAGVPEPIRIRLLDRYIKNLVVNRRLREAVPLVAQYEALVLDDPWFRAKRDSTLGLYRNFLGGGKHDGIERSLSSAREFLALGDHYQAMLSFINVLTFLSPQVARTEVWPTLEDLNRRVREPYLWGIGLFNYGMLLFRHGYLDLGHEKVTQSLRYEPPLDTGRCDSLNFLALHGWLSGNPDLAAQHRRELRAFAASTSNLRGTGLADQLDGIAALGEGRGAQAAELLARAQEILGSQGETVNLLVSEAWGALALAQAGRTAEAVARATQTATQVLGFETFSELSFPAMVHAPLARVLKDQDPTVARALVSRALGAMAAVLDQIGDREAEAAYRDLPFHRDLVDLAGSLGIRAVTEQPVTE